MPGTPALHLNFSGFDDVLRLQSIDGPAREIMQKGDRVSPKFSWHILTAEHNIAPFNLFNSSATLMKAWLFKNFSHKNYSVKKATRA